MTVATQRDIGELLAIYHRNKGPKIIAEIEGEIHRIEVIVESKHDNAQALLDMANELNKLHCFMVAMVGIANVMMDCETNLAVNMGDLDQLTIDDCLQ